ncbi:carbonic anhydrase family protein [Vibrio sp. FNV 38]|nr:carbonic anhydrase family protein [Vibrio sp. FNV 38]
MQKLAIALAIVTASFTTQASEWGYGDHNGPQEWGAISSICADGKNQSPINVDKPLAAQMEPMKLTYQGKVVSLLNNGHTLQAGVEGDNYLTVDGKRFDLLQFHFHTPSENLIRSQQFPLEAHFVHADKDGNLAVVAVMFEINQENKALTQLTGELPTSGSSVELAHAFDASALLPKTDNYFRFNGSLTTPPCSEGVRWFVLEQPQTLSDSQEKALSTAMGKNNRPIQDLNARKVMFSH